MTREILEYFEHGAGAAFQRRSALAVQETEAGVPWHRRFFFWEGYAFGTAAVWAFGPRRGNPDSARITSGYRAMHYTGYGFWNGVARLYRLPLVPVAPECWADVPDYDRLSPLVAGGAAFAVACTRQEIGQRVVRRTTLRRERSWTRGALHGCGRALWFLRMHDVDALEAAVRADPDHREELLEGVGIAIGFTNLGTPGSIIEIIGQFPAASQLGLLRGVGVALYQGTEEDPANRARIEGLGLPLTAVYEMCQWAARTTPNGSDWYWQCCELGRPPLA